MYGGFGLIGMELHFLFKACSPNRLGKEIRMPDGRMASKLYNGFNVNYSGQHGSIIGKRRIGRPLRFFS